MWDTWKYQTVGYTWALIRIQLTASFIQLITCNTQRKLIMTHSTFPSRCGSWGPVSCVLSSVLSEMSFYVTFDQTKIRPLTVSSKLIPFFSVANCGLLVYKVRRPRRIKENWRNYWLKIRISHRPRLEVLIMLGNHQNSLSICSIF